MKGIDERLIGNERWGPALTQLAFEFYEAQLVGGEFLERQGPLMGVEPGHQALHIRVLGRRVYVT